MPILLFYLHIVSGDGRKKENEIIEYKQQSIKKSKETVGKKRSFFTTI
jgi:hypothetical protein